MPTREPKPAQFEAPPLEEFSESLAGSKGPCRLDHHGLRQHAAPVAERPEGRQEHRAHHPRRGPHLRHGVDHPAGWHLRQPGPALQAARSGHAAVLPRGERRPDPRGRHHRSRFDGVVHRVGYVVLELQRRHDSVLHLLLDVRLPAHRRHGVGVRRRARQRLPDGRVPPAARRCSGEGLQHQDGHSLVLASTVPTCHAYDPAYVYEIAVIVQDGMRRMYEANEDRFYYITRVQRRLPDAGDAQGLRRGHSARDLQVPCSRQRQRDGAACSAAVPSSTKRCGRRRFLPRSTASPPTSGA